MVLDVGREFSSGGCLSSHTDEGRSEGDDYKPYPFKGSACRVPPGTSTRSYHGAGELPEQLSSCMFVGLGAAQWIAKAGVAIMEEVRVCHQGVRSAI